ncbi:MAG: sulfur transferase selenocysteine-containing protein [Nitrospirae bacterium]|nr:MAG: sulfur transferase selenocysteine-containing protein [Nitrospirota bacterium]
MKRPSVFLKGLLAFTAGAVLFAAPAFAQQPVPQKPTLLKPCSQCHPAADKVLRGMIGSISGKAETFAVNTGAIWTVKFDDDTKLSGWAQPLAKMPKEKEIAVTYVEKNGELYAKAVSVKQPAVVPPDKLVSTSQMIDLVQKGSALIVDSRPASRFYEGAIPGAINIYDADFDKHIDKLPADKNKTLVFYCAGPT